MSESNSNTQQPSSPRYEARIKEFRSLIKRAVLLDRAETTLFDSIPDILWDRILTKNFNDNMALAERVLLNKYHEIDVIDRPLLEQKKKNIRNLDNCSKELKEHIISGKKVLFLTDNDNDGSMAQAVFLEFFNSLPENFKNNIRKSYAQPIGKTRGLNKENIDLLMEFFGWTVDDEVLVVTADIGINNGPDQKEILDSYPNMKLIVTDHHLPVKDLVITENERSSIFNPKYQPTEFFKKKNISGANTLSVLLKNVLATAKSENTEFANIDIDVAIKNMDELSDWSNLLDYVEADIADMPLRPYIIAKALKLRALLNVSNSMAQLVTLDWNDSDWDRLKSEIPDLDVELIKNSVLSVKNLNRFAQKLLALEIKLANQKDIDEQSFYYELSETLNDEDAVFDSPNPNYLAQLRPHIFRYSAIDNKYTSLDLLKDQMVLLYEDLRKVEKDLVKSLQKTEMLESIRAENSTIVFPKSAFLTQIFSRKLLNKIYNEENNGFFITLDKISSNEYSGSMRSLYNVSEIFPDKEKVEKDLGIKLEILGHEKAAGFKITGVGNTVVDINLLTKLNDYINTQIEGLKLIEKEQLLPFLHIDFASAGLVHKINTAVKGHLSNMNALPSVISLGTQGKDNLWVTDSETTSQISLSEVVKKRKYGYQPIQTDFQGHAFIIPVEQLRTVVEQKFKPVVKMSYMDDGVFIAHQVVDPKSLKNLIPFKGDRKASNELIGYYWETYRESNFIPLSRDDFKNLPYFKFNSYGQSEFDHWEQLIISLLEKTNQDILAVIDTEGTGLGLAPKCFNIGGTNIKIKENSGSVIDEDDFDNLMYKDQSGQAYLLKESHLKKLLTAEDLEKSKIKNPDKLWKIFKGNETGGVEHDKEYFLKEKPEDVIRLTNYWRKNGEVFFNRQIEGFAFSFLVKDEDLHITKELENLTGIAQDMVETFGTTTSEVDEILTDYYSSLKNPDGTNAKIIFSAHNLPYDKGVCQSNFNKFNALLDEHVLCDSKNLARKAKLAYDDTPVASFEKIAGLPRQLFFYDSPYSSYSLTTFLDRVTRGKDGVFPDTSGRYLLRSSNQGTTFSLIDKKEFNEYLLNETIDTLYKKKHSTQMPNNAVKFSVEKLSTRAMVRNIILHDYEKPTQVDLEIDELPFASALAAFQDQYHFDNTLEENIRFFQISRHNKNDNLKGEILYKVGQRFLQKNREVQAKFHDGWIYEKVLDKYEPAVNEGKISQDLINQINYYTDVPRKKIEKILQDTVKFKKKFGIQSALVHEQHNNIIQRSADGQGLSDTAYESALPTLLAMMKFYNPYTQSSQEAINEIIDVNLKGAMLQLMVKKDHQDLAALDSFSMRQMQAFDREMKTDLVNRAQIWAKSGGWDESNTPIRFKLGAHSLPPGSAVYGTPLRALTPEEIKDSSEKLNYILINEQFKTASTISRSISSGHGERLREMAEANDELAIKYRDILLTRFKKVEFQRKEATIKKLSELMGKAFSGEVPIINSSLIKEIKKNPELLVTAASLQATHHNIDMRLGKPAFLSPKTAECITEFLDQLTNIVSENEILIGKKAKKSAKAVSAHLTNYESSTVRTANFLPELDIRRDEPLKFILNNAGPAFLGKYLELQSEENNSVSSIKPSSMSKRRF